MLNLFLTENKRGNMYQVLDSHLPSDIGDKVPDLWGYLGDLDENGVLQVGLYSAPPGTGPLVNLPPPIQVIRSYPGRPLTEEELLPKVWRGGKCETRLSWYSSRH